MTQRILIVSDDEPTESLRRALEAKGFIVTIASDASDGYRQITERRFELVVVNLLTAIDGAGLIRKIRSSPGVGELKVLTIAEWGTGQATLALTQGADRFEPTPIDSNRVVKAVETLLR
ncbi:MAG TPA: response regulator, partial [Pyrinomonadaceae bacterium]|nr:response regulator [Pyrinomonadaceae bacterium]